MENNEEENYDVNLLEDEFEIDNWTEEEEEDVYATENDIWFLKLFKNENNGYMEIELKVKKSYDYQKIYKFNFTIYNKDDDTNFIISDGFTRFGMKDFTSGRLKIFRIKSLIKKRIINDENDGFKLKFTITSKIVPLYDYINCITSKINDKYRKEVLEEDYYEWIFENEQNERIDQNNPLESNEFLIGGYKWKLLLEKNEKN